MYIYNESGVDFTSPTRSILPTVVYVDFVTSEFGLSLDYFPLIPKVHKIAVVSVAIHTFRNNYISVCRRQSFYLLIVGYGLLHCSKKIKKKKLQDPTLNFLIGVPNTEYTRWPVGWLGEAKVSCILRHRSVQLIFAYSWARPAILASGKGRGGMFLFLLFLHFHSFFFLSCLSFLSPLLSPISLLLSLGDDIKWPTRVTVSLNPNSVKSVARCPVTKHGPFTDLWANKKSVSVGRE